MSNQAKTQPLPSFLNPSILRSNLIIVGLYIAAFELLHDSVVDRLKQFYAPRLQLPPGRDYKSQVTNGRKVRKGRKRRKRVRAVLPTSLAWLKREGVIDKADMKNFKKAEKLRNRLTHEMGQMLWEGLPSELRARLFDMVALLDKIERWWTINVDVTAPDQIDETAIVPGKSIGLRLLMEIALGSEEGIAEVSR